MDIASVGFKELRNKNWYQGNGVPIKIKDMKDSHVLNAIIKIERENTPSKMGNNNVWVILPILHGEVVYRNLKQKLIEYRIRDAMKHGDTRRLVIATADKENSNGRTPDAQAKGDVP